MVASVPLETSRSISSPGTRAHIASASRTSLSVGAPKLVPSSAAAATARTTCSGAWPRMPGP